MMQDSQGIVGCEFDGISNSDLRYQTTRSIDTELEKALFQCILGVAIAIVTSRQDYKIDASVDVHQLTPNTHMYWIPGSMMLNAVSGIAPIS